ncbi:sodium-translocating pyrophosphatase [Geodermatophilus sp. YIM 151500]|uniref:sodium-translocating pyrophosphatase n=1 Tax=Geodermatophilus sp. YIM 151500 TaxID=2984531 RepID=UPI0021E47081|nr:sodium-translocating pyrophosphatase [Geodermatophilus sp. YIM 151500]MCV2491752.1 sodium-translocating pyrophosphatase [Geodermatophilus sp. YIM 151500]
MPDSALSGGDWVLVWIVLVISLAALGFAYYLVRAVLAADQGTTTMRDISRAVQEGAAAYLRRQFKTLGVFAVIVFLLLLLLPVAEGGWETRVGRAVFFLVGALFSALVGFIGMTLATRGNVRVAAAARTGGYRPAFRIAYRTGGVCGAITVGLGLFGAALAVLFFNETAPVVLEGFGFGGALLAMFMRVGGGIFTKAADVGADLVGKVEAGIPEDDPRNAATIADNVGDNVGDCAGMAADLFESYAVTLVAALILGQVFFGAIGMVFPLVVAAIGVLASVVGVLASNPGKSDSSGLAPINRGFFASAAVSLVLVAVAAFTVLPSTADGFDTAVSPQVLGFVSVLVGIVLAAAIQQLTGYFTETSRKPVKDVGRSSLTGPATVILSGMSLGLESAVYAAVLIGGAVYAAFLIGGGAALYAVALAGTGLLTTAGVIVSMDTFGPVSDNAQGIAEMSGDIDETGARVLTDLDAVGNTTKAITKGIAIATAVLAATALFGSYNEQVRIALEGLELGDAFSLVRPNNVVGAVLGAAVVFLFSGLAINAVSRAAGRVVFEVREQFRTRPGIMDFSERPDYSKVVDICTKDSLRELATPGLLAVLAPVAVGFGLGFGPLAAYLIGAIAAGTLMAVFLANSGGAWDNAKKMVEDGAYGGKGSEAHAATVIGDTVGDPFKDTAGPAINPLIKVMNLVALLIAPAVVSLQVGDGANTTVRVLIALGAVAIVVGAVVVSKRRSVVVGDASTTSPQSLTTSAP